MNQIVWLCGLLLLYASGSIYAKKQDHGNLIIIDEDVNTTLGNPSGSGSGLCPDDEDDCDQSSGSGFGGFDDEVTTEIFTVTKSQLSSCEQLRKSIVDNNPSSDSILIPTCLENGDYRRLQCNNQNGDDRECWCVDTSGRQITGTLRKKSLIPDCEKGTNLAPCVFKFVQSRHGLLGEHIPRCLENGDFEKIQCFEADCWCVKDNGREITGTRRTLPDHPNCDEETDPIQEVDVEIVPKPPVTEEPKSTRRHHDHHKKITTKKPEVYVINTAEGTKLDKDKTDKKINVEIADVNDELPEEEQFPEDNYSSARSRDATAAEQIMNQPGLLAAIISGAVVGLLCAVLLIMFIVYRMRKKDEGSYALDEPKKYDNIAYTKAPDKEFYA